MSFSIKQISDPNFDLALNNLLSIATARTPRGKIHTNRQSVAHSLMASANNDELDTERVIQAYQQAKNRIDKLNISTLLKT